MNDDLFGAPKKGARDAADYSAKDIEVLEGLEPVRRRPGMYIGGTDEAALHHLAAEILDNAMDEAVAGHASRIEMRAGGRQFPDRARQRPRHPGRSAPEIQEPLGAGGDPHHAAFRRQVRRQGLRHLRRPARRRRFGGQRAVRRAGGRGRARPHAVEAGLCPRQADDQADQRRRRSTTGAAPRSASSPTRRSSAPLQFQPARLYRLCRSKAYLFRGVEIRWACDPSLLPARDDTPAEAVLHFPGGLRDSLEADIGAAAARRAALGRRGRPAGRRRRAEGRAGRMGGRLAGGRRGLPAFLLQHRPHRAGRHARGRLPHRPAEGRCAPGASSATTAAPPRSPPRTSPAAWPPSSRSSSATRNSRARPRKSSPAPKPRAWSKRRCATVSTISSPATRPPPTICSTYVIERAEERLRRKRS